MPNDVTAILRLTDFSGRLLLAFYGLATTLVAILNLPGLHWPITGIISLVLLWVSLVLLGLPGAQPFALAPTIALVVLTTMISAVSPWSIANLDNPGYATWHMGSVTFILLVLTLRGRPGFAWFGFGLFAALTMLWTLTTDQVVMGGVENILRQGANLLIGTLFARFLVRASETITAIQSKQLTGTAQHAARAAEVQERERQVFRLERDARPALEQIVATTTFTEAELRDFGLLEASLRDGIRAAGFSSERLSAETRAARERGLHVVLLDDRGEELVDGERERVEDALIHELHTSRSGTITARLSPFGREDVATIVVDEEGVFRRIVVGADEVEVTYLGQ